MSAKHWAGIVGCRHQRELSPGVHPTAGQPGKEITRHGVQCSVSLATGTPQICSVTPCAHVLTFGEMALLQP